MTSDTSDVPTQATPHPTHITQVSTLLSLARQYPQGLTRPDLMDMLTLGRNAVDRRIHTALDLGLITHTGRGESTGGRAPEEWQFRGNAATILAMRISYRTTTCALTDLSGTLLAQEEIELGLLDTPEQVLPQALAALRHLKEAAPSTPWGLAASLPLPVDFRSGSIVDPEVRDASGTRWPTVPLRQELTRRTGLPTWVDDEVNTMALAAATRVGAPKDLLYVRFSIGLGLGLISDHHVHRGAGGGTGELAHIQVISSGGPSCRCGRTGCLETIVSGLALERAATQPNALASSAYLRRAAEEGAIESSTVFHGVRDGDATCTRLVTEMTERLASVLAVLTTTYNPGEIILGGDVVEAGPGVAGVLDHALRGRILTRASSRLRIRMGSPDDALTGLARLATERLLSPRTLGLWMEHGSPVGVSSLLTSHRQDL